MLCERRQGRDDQQPSRTANLESSAHNWPTAESVTTERKEEKKITTTPLIRQSVLGSGRSTSVHFPKSLKMYVELSSLLYLYIYAVCV